MDEYNCFKILVLIVLFPTVYGDIFFNDLHHRLFLSLVNVTPVHNVVASERLVRFSLCKLATVAKGDSKRELMLLLGYKDDEALSKCYKKLRPYMNLMRQSDLTVTNRIYVNYTKGINPKFIQNSTENDGVRVANVGFNYPKAATAHINNLISVMTFRRITDIVDIDDIDKSTKMIIISGAHYKGTWESLFDYRLTKLEKFNHIDGRTSRVPMMTKVGEFMHKDHNDCEVLKLRFMSIQTTMTIILPKSPQGLILILQRMFNEKEFLGTLINGLQEKSMRISFPRFKIKTFVDWTGFLQGLGLYSVFNANSSDMAGIFNNGPNQTIHLSKVKQKVFVQIDEMGVSRPNPDRLDFNEKDPEVVPSYYRLPQFIADKPFYFEIALELDDGRYELFTDRLDFNEKDPEVVPSYYRLPQFIADKPFYFEIALELDDGRYELFTGVYFGPEPDLPTF